MAKDHDSRREDLIDLLDEISDKLSDLRDLVERTFPYSRDDDYSDSSDDFDDD